MDTQMKTVYVSAGRTVEIEWENEPITGQIQIYKYAGEYNEITGTAPGTPLKGAVYEIINARSGKVVDYITTDSRGVAASKPLPLTRYQIREVSAPAYWQVSAQVFDVTLEYAGQIIKLNAYDKTAELGVSITKRGNAAVLAGNQMRYDITVANTSNVDLESFYWHDRIPTDVARATTLTTGTYSARLNYRILYKTNYTANYQVLASNLLTSNNYSFALNAIPMQAGEVITDIYFDFGKVPVGFQSVSNPTLSVMVNGNAVNGYYMTNRADVGGKYLGTWQTANASWVTIIQRYGTSAPSAEESDWGFQEEQKTSAPESETPAPIKPSKSDRQKFFELKFHELDRHLTPEERQEWNTIYASYRGRSAITATIIGVDPLSVYVWNPKTEQREKKTMYCAIVVPYRVRIVIPASEMWEEGEERPDYVLQNMVGATVDLIIIKVEREGGFAIGSRRLANRSQRYFFAHREDLHRIGARVKCRMLAVGPRRCLVDCYGHDLDITQREMRYTSLSNHYNRTLRAFCFRYGEIWFHLSMQPTPASRIKCF